MARIRPCSEERAAILSIVNSAAEAYRGRIPPDCWHEPYMGSDELGAEIAAGVSFSGYERDRELAGVMGVQSVGEVDLIRHAYTVPPGQRDGVGTALLRSEGQHHSAIPERQMDASVVLGDQRFLPAGSPATKSS